MMMMVGLVGSAVVDARLILPGELLQQWFAIMIRRKQ